MRDLNGKGSRACGEAAELPREQERMGKRPTIGLGVATYNRPAFFEASFSAVAHRLHDALDFIFVYDDGSDEDLRDEYRRIYERFRSSDKITFMRNKTNYGIAHAKNKLLKAMLEKECDFLFVADDDIIPLCDEAVNGYVRISEHTGIGHLGFAHHGMLNETPVVIDGPLTFWPYCIGAWSFYTRDCIKRTGLMDARLRNSLHEYEFANRIAQLGLTSPFGFFADATGSEQWLSEIAHTDAMSVAKSDPSWQRNMEAGAELWRQKDGVGIPANPEFLINHPWPGSAEWRLNPRWS
ncbi:MAG: glycosyltransferase [Coriobacteriia bacterium]|nr:glycosyltransferase [Coriobacteriia bacterium]